MQPESSLYKRTINFQVLPKFISLPKNYRDHFVTDGPSDYTGAANGTGWMTETNSVNLCNILSRTLAAQETTHAFCSWIIMGHTLSSYG